MQKILLLFILVLLVVNAAQVSQTDASLEFAKTIGEDNVYLNFENHELRKLLEYSQENNGELPDFTPIDYNT